MRNLHNKQLNYNEFNINVTSRPQRNAIKRNLNIELVRITRHDHGTATWPRTTPGNCKIHETIDFHTSITRCLPFSKERVILPRYWISGGTIIPAGSFLSVSRKGSGLWNPFPRNSRCADPSRPRIQRNSRGYERNIEQERKGEIPIWHRRNDPLPERFRRLGTSKRNPLVELFLPAARASSPHPFTTPISTNQPTPTATGIPLIAETSLLVARRSGPDRTGPVQSFYCVINILINTELASRKTTFLPSETADALPT